MDDMGVSKLSAKVFFKKWTTPLIIIMEIMETLSGLQDHNIFWPWWNITGVYVCVCTVDSAFRQDLWVTVICEFVYLHSCSGS